ncbi:MAG TPA: glycosyl transferase family 2 [Candidatus Binatia bacterium]
MARKYPSALRENVHLWLRQISNVDILVAIPCFNNEDTIEYVVQQAGIGLARYFPDQKCAVFVCDGGSLDDTRERVYETPTPEGILKRVTIYRGLPGKGSSLRGVFELVILSKAKAAAMVDSDLSSITPEWIKSLIQPILDRSAAFVAPFYRRHKFDGTITNQIVYPMTRALYGVDIRQPIGGDFGFSPELAAFYMDEDVWDTDVARFGIDIWMTTSAINEGFKVVQAYLGTKIHGAKDPGSDLGPMFQQVISTLFYLMGKYERSWRHENSHETVPINALKEEDLQLTPVSVSLTKLNSEFVDGFNHFRPMYQEILSPENWEKLSAIHRKWGAGEKAELDADLWSRILYDFACVYQLWERNRRTLVNIITPLYFGRTKSYCEQVMDMTYDEAEAVVQEQAAIFEKNKPYLFKRFSNWGK